MDEPHRVPIEPAIDLHAFHPRDVVSVVESTLDDPRPLEDGCTCPACTQFSRAYVRHLVNQDELLGLRLLSLHNLHFLVELTAGARAAIERGELRPYVAERLARLDGTAAL